MKLPRIPFGAFASGLVLMPTLLSAQSPAATPSTTDGDEVVNLTEFVVTGSSIRGQEVPVGSQLVNLSREDIQMVGAQTTRDLIATVPQFSQFNIASTPAVQATEAPNLRSLGSGATLTLLNGRRMVGAGVVGTSADPSALPPSAIERIQIVPDGSSAVYGSDAVAGVINVVTRRDYNGAEASARLGFADHYMTRNFNLVAGQTWTGGSLLLAFEHSYNTNLQGADRDYVTNDLRAFGGPDTRTTNTAQPNVVVGGVTYAYPALLPNTTNYRDTAKDADLVPENKRNSVMATLRHTLSDRIEVFADMNYSQNDSWNAQPMNTFNAFTFTMTDANPYFKAPPGTNARSISVRYSFGDEFGNAPPLIWEANAGGATVGANVKLSAEWNVEVYGNYGWGRSQLAQTILDTTTALAAVSGTTPSTAFDPFTGLTNRAIMEKINDTVYIDRAHQELTEGVIKADGPLFTWAGGIVRAAVGGGARLEVFKPTPIKGPIDTVVPITLKADREVQSVFAELLIPVVSPEKARSGVRRLDLSLAGRMEKYDSFGETTNPKVGINWEPFRGLTVRGSYGTSFRAPALSSVQSVATAVQVRPNFSSPGNLTPPGTGAMNSLNIIGGNPNLGPEEATTQSIGFDFVSTKLNGFRVAATFYTIEYTNVVGAPQNRFANPNLAFTYIVNPTEAQIDAWTKGIVFAGTRFGPGETGIITDSRVQNLRSLLVDGLDYEVSQRWSTSIGSFAANVGGTTYLSYETAAAPGVAAVNQLLQGTVKTKIRTGLNWRRGQIGAGVAVNYTGSYTNAAATPAQKVDPFVTLDLNFAWSIRSDGWLKDTDLALNLNNALDEDPPRLLSGNGMSTGLANPIGRLISVSLKKRF